MISEEFTVAPEVVYSPIVPAYQFVTNKSDPDTTMLTGSFKPDPEISEAFTVVPEVVYSPIVFWAPFAINKSDPETSIPPGSLIVVRKEEFIVAPEVVYSPTTPLPVTKVCAWAALIEQRPRRAANSLLRDFLEVVLDNFIMP